MYAADTMPTTTTTRMILAAAALAAVLVAAAGCPLGCTCKWKGGKQTVECINRSLTVIPAGMDAGTQVLDMSGNSIDALSRGRFMSAGLSNLQKIFMARCRITYLDDAAFQGLSNLVELDLSDNAITDIPTKSFDDYPQLMKLVLSGNAVTVVRTAAFKRLTYLTYLDLSRCRVSTVEPGAFDGLHSIEWLRLDYNQIVRIEAAGGAVVLPLSLHGIEMHHNPWSCDCRLRDVHRWLNNNSAPHTVEPTCHGPDRLRGTVIRKLATEELACAPVATAASPEYVETDAGKNVTLACRVTPVGQSRISWWFEGRQVANGTAAAGVELSIEDAGPADNGSYACVAENRAGWAACNFTVRVIQEPSEVAAGSYPPDAPPPALLVVVLAGAVCFVAVAVVCAVACRLTMTKRRRRRDHNGRPVGKSGGAGGGDASADDPSNSGQGAKATSDIRQSDSVNLTVSSTIDGKLSSAEDVSVYGEYDAAAGPGSSVGYEVHEVLHVGGGGYDAYQQVHVAAGHPVTAAATTTLEANPDLISDASTVIRDNVGGDYCDASDEVYKIAVPPPPPGGRDFWTSSGASSATIVYPSSGGCGSYELQLSPGKLAAGEPYPADYGLPKLSSGQYPVPAPPSLYRTLPHRRNAAKPQGRSCQEAEFVLLQQHHHHHHHHHQQQQQHQHHMTRYEPQNVRYNQQGYPYPASAAAADAAYYATAAAAFYEPPSLSNASAQTLDDDTMVMMMMMPPPPPTQLVAGAAALPPTGRQPQHLAGEHAGQHKAVAAVQKQPANTESPDEGYVGEGPDS
ncbi:leucine-rich repeat-containing protein 24-like [Rhopalosiphum padi]|uniref:leucine-rich repeat-containing protein 24-like n=1 Tax=Rhopalosiphum padi TaxID=40932 RepID=UPI00298E7991|nr:leucine-rich repeat-containing protein 24-like [Rhopalosiphum padi]XP_060849747.1 leucine-rich repeat-containing protein 24-like [Rhopalosiphum padi]XP_060849748.1 leucine-rich repeat-containing protein 24-like [Rhopalosiphum padi]XP_060849749.1 leucine-rich repeat-containing protein 24-like [Rhopalosiphum padi]XP_060849750.1 leucine-rich repeat-containing protein 24-like [Rhopalosiphum padi]XP_060849751.1 leucine-rich repeat-containing protein 24-like [Rhopalosiphum padi]